jgi:phosphoglycolate phosphatase-like HAD superfamily hydrolase
LILFDIDGTLVWGGPAKDAFQMAMVDTFGTHGDVEGVSFAGKTDPQIVRELLHREGVADDDIDGALPDLWMRYLARLESMLPGRPMRVLAGVTALLDALEATEEAVLGLVTGNIVGGARLKLGSVGLFHRFAVGAFASDHECRNELPGIALERARQTLGMEFTPDQAVIVGDTPKDVACGRHGGTRTVAVATGHHGVEELRRTGADHVLPDLSDTRRVMAALLA